MKLHHLSLGILAYSLTTWAQAAIAVVAPEQGLPLEDGGLFALAAACLAVGIRIVRSKRNR